MIFMKKERQAKLIELIGKKPIETQEDLQKELLDAGFDVTQATVSRDIKELRIVKLLDANGIYRYATGSTGSNGKTLKYRELFTHSVISVDYAMNDVVIKCHTGMAQGACAALDMMHFDNIVGTLAGDDTIFIIARTEDDAKELCSQIGSAIE